MWYHGTVATTYHLDLAKIPLSEFYDTLFDGNISPGRHILLQEKESRRKTLEDRGISTLADLVDALKTKKRLTVLAGETGIDEEYLTILGRQARSYVPAPVALGRFEGVQPAVLKALKAQGITQTKQLYQARQAAASDHALSESIGVEPDDLRELLVMTDLVRINGVGPVFARLFIEAGVKGLGDLVRRDAKRLLERVNEAIEAQGYHGPAATLWDIEHCISFAGRLASA